MNCKDGKRQHSLTKSIRQHALVKATLAIATSMALTLTGTTAIAGSAHSFTEYARVVRVDPIYRNVTVSEPQRICRPVVQHNRYQRRHHRNHNNHNYNRHTPQRSNRTHRTRSGSQGEVFVAGVIGGAIGRELSRSVNGRPSNGATIAGAVIGSALANSAIKDNHRRAQNRHSTNRRSSQHHFAPADNRFDSHRQHHSTVGHNRRGGHDQGIRYDRDSHHNRNRQHCTTTMQTRTERRQDGFNVTYRYHGHRYQTRTRNHPGDQLAITVSVKPQNH